MNETELITKGTEFFEYGVIINKKLQNSWIN